MITSDMITFDLPKQLACPRPTELRPIARDEVRLLVTQDDGSNHHTAFHQLANFLDAGDVLVVNTSAVQAAALPIDLPGGRSGRLHFSTRTGSHEWLVEIREVVNNRTIRWQEGEAGMRFKLPGQAILQLQSQFYQDRSLLHLWAARFSATQDLVDYLAQYGQPIQYENLHKQYPLDYYQTHFANQPGSSEMPSAGRGFTQRVLDRLIRKGIHIAPILLHTGVSSLEVNEKPYPEYFEVDAVSSAIINNAKRKGKRVIAVGTTAIRATESAANAQGQVQPTKGYTELYITSEHQMKVADGLLTGFHEPQASHLHMLQAVAGQAHIERAYTEAIDAGYYWHQFGDLHLILPS